MFTKQRHDDRDSKLSQNAFFSSFFLLLSRVKQNEVHKQLSIAINRLNNHAIIKTLLSIVWFNRSETFALKKKKKYELWSRNYGWIMTYHFTATTKTKKICFHISEKRIK